MEHHKTVIVVGGGLAGASAAIEAYNHGSKVFLVEKEKDVGGNSAKASSGMNAVGTEVQRKKGVEDSVPLFTEDVIKSGHGLSDESLVKILVERSASAEEFIESFGVYLDVLSQLGGHSAARTHRPSPPPDRPPVNVGYAIMSALKTHINSLPKEKMIVLRDAHVIQLIIETVEDKKVVRGVVYETSGNLEQHKIEGDSVILTTGGFSFNSDMIKKFAPQLAHLSTTNGSFAMGEGLDLAAPLTPALRLMDQIQVHPTSFVDPNNSNSHFRILAPEALRGSGGILLNQEGKRFANELGLRDYVTKQIFENCHHFGEGGPIVAFLLMSEEAVEIFQAPNLGFYKFKKLVKEFESPRAFAKELGLPVEAVMESIKLYNENKEKGKDEFGKKTFPASFSADGPVHGMMITPGIHYTMGGLQTNSNCEVVSKDTIEPIPGLFAAGEVTGGVHGANRLGGNSLLECTVFGRMAGEQASK